MAQMQHTGTGPNLEGVTTWSKTGNRKTITKFKTKQQLHSQVNFVLDTSSQPALALPAYPSPSSSPNWYTTTPSADTGRCTYIRPCADPDSMCTYIHTFSPKNTIIISVPRSSGDFHSLPSSIELLQLSPHNLKTPQPLRHAPTPAPGQSF